APVISNANDEKTHTLYAAANISYRLRDNLSIYITSKNKVTFYDIDYSGSYNNNYRQVFGDYYINPGVTWNPKSGLTFTLIPALSISQRKIQDEKTSTALNPNVYISTNWYQTEKSYLNFWYQLNTNQVQASHANDVVQRESELIWYMGTLDLLSYNAMNLGLQQTWMCTPWFTPTLVLQYNNINHSYYRQYDAAPEDMGGLIHHYVDCGPQNTLMLGAHLQFNLFNRRLNFYVQPLWKMDQFSDKQQPFTSHRMLLYGYMGYNLGNFSVHANYRCATKSYYNRGMYYEYFPDNWSAGISYGNGNLYASFEVDNIFRTTNNQTLTFHFDNYQSIQNYGHTGRTFSLNLSYTFGYGKRVSHDINIDNSSNFQSGA
ncbi:MAG: hypothetical protein K2I91_03265, partial [Muribaculaceae bacterium]|nr:hypothetical protein [Muribaculaceae bacterium]